MDNIVPYQNSDRSDLDITTHEGRELYRTATKWLKNKYKFSEKNVEDFSTDVKETSEKFCWGPVVNDIPVKWNNDGTVMITKSLFQVEEAISLKEVMEAADLLWTDNDKTMYIKTDGITLEMSQKRIRSTMIAHWINNSTFSKIQLLVNCWP